MIGAQQGTLSLSFPTLEPSGSLMVGLNSASDYGKISIDGNAALTGIFRAELNNGFVPAAGDSFTVLSYPSSSGSFTSLELPANVGWQELFSTTSLMLKAGQSVTTPMLSITRSGGTVTISWPSVPTWSLWQNSDLAMPGGWTASSGITTVHSTNYLDVLLPAGSLFFRLREP
jgi:hypothetical protein